MTDKTITVTNSETTRNDLTVVEQPLSDLAQWRGANLEKIPLAGPLLNDGNVVFCGITHDLGGLLRADCLGTREAVTERWHEADTIHLAPPAATPPMPKKPPQRQ